jgi:hypothetical protein
MPTGKAELIPLATPHGPAPARGPGLPWNRPSPRDAPVITAMPRQLHLEDADGATLAEDVAASDQLPLFDNQPPAGPAEVVIGVPAGKRIPQSRPE